MSHAIDQYLGEPGQGNALDAASVRAGLEASREEIFRQFDDQVAPEILVKAGAEVVDRVLHACFIQHFGEKAPICLVAVGGYGRSELLPGSDIDLMLLLDKKPGKALQEDIAAFLTFLWDIGMEVGHSVRTPRDCAREGKADVTVMTTMIE